MYEKKTKVSYCFFKLLSKNYKYNESGSNKYFKKLNHNYELFQVQGSLEVPTMISILLSKKKYDAVVAIGCIIRGKTSHYDFICGNIVSSLLNLSIKKSIPISNAILNCENMSQATERCSAKKNRAKESVDAALSILKNL